MRTRLSPDNPYGHGRHAFAWERVPTHSAAHLDFGCFDGVFLDSLRRKGVARLVGVDASREAVEQAHRRFPGLDVRHSSQTVPLEFADGTFSSATLLDVLEHVYEQAELLGELARVLKDGGRLIVTVPRRYALSALDLGNLKFRFPRLHRRLFCLTHSHAQYQRRYVANPDGLVGDVSAKKRWHEHFSENHLRQMLSQAGFNVVECDGAGFFTRPLSPLLTLLRRVLRLKGIARRIQNLDARCFHAMNLFCVAEKKRAE